MTIIDAIDKLGYAGYILGEDIDGIYLDRSKDKESMPLCDPLLSEALDSLVSNSQAVVCYYSGRHP